ncbi:hypothetical protein AB0903_09525 [Streptomyces sp. NPDC048389]|uniref:hypothetical protein n=1 Tax=Streptomyces sp. NPDC048389 TaxID=3154622 RepID=UPI003453C49C
MGCSKGAARRAMNTAICDGIHGRMSPVERAGLLRLLEERDADGATHTNGIIPHPASRAGQ